MKFRYEDLNVTENINEYVQVVYGIVVKFPQDEKYGLVSQIKRSATSVLLNLAEGSARNSRKDFSRFITISLGSLAESQAALKLAKTLGYVSSQDLEKLEPIIEKIWYRLCALRKSQQ